MMRFILFLMSCFLIAHTAESQETISGKLTHGGIERSYELYVPEMYTGEKEVPLVFNFHGYTSNAKQQMKYGDFRPIADTANFLVVHPQGTLLDGKTHFNVGGWTYESSTDDVGFTSALIDELSKKYTIDQSRIYSTGMSNGGFMSFVLACELSDRIAAIASVTGSMTPQTFAKCSPTHPMPIMQIHGTEYPTVPFKGNQLWTKPIEEVMSYWVDENGCDVKMKEEVIEDIDKEDNSTAKKVTYADCQNRIENVHFVINGGKHNWPGSVVNRPGTNQDFNASLEIWKFFKQYNLDQLREQ